MLNQKGLHLQRASAGSGKTYTLAKTFIIDLLVDTEGGNVARLRIKEEVADTLPRILAITFTNKATNEMKQRIVERLADLAHPLSDTPYLQDIIHLTGASKHQIATLAADALSLLLNNYSDFRVSTIDSFFQTVLRTFAYEADLNDTYQVELDADYLAQQALDSLLDDINSGKNRNADFWMRKLMNDALADNKSWNVFQKRSGRNSIYSTIIQAIKGVESEDFKKNREAIDAWAESHGDFIKKYQQMQSQLHEQLRTAHNEAKARIAGLRNLFTSAGLTEKDGRQYMWGQLQKVESTRPSAIPAKVKWLEWKEGDVAVAKGKLKSVDAATVSKLTEAAIETYGALERWRDLLESPDAKMRQTYLELLPYLGIIVETRQHMHELLSDSNAVKMSDTNSILRSIIGDDDAPFIYERLGSRLHNYLIDEFQDTSELQWEVLRPLVKESDSNGHDNLIIGDAKQSIYRFRNAEPALISSIVPREFPRHIDNDKDHIGKIQPSTNWRSLRNIVDFNNFLFSNLSRKIEVKPSDYIHATDIYSNVVQTPKHKEERGYVAINFVDSDTVKQTGDNEMVRYPYLGPLIAELRQRGYRQRDIAILVRTNKTGKDSIASLIDYNTSLPEGEEAIDFISEESLAISSSPAVKLVISALENINSGLRGDTVANYSFYAMQHPELGATSHAEHFKTEEVNLDSLRKMLCNMEAVALPALVEAIIANFMPKTMQERQGMFLAALQDAVLDYCESHNTDIGSFLEWWKKRGAALSISSPEGTDAVQVMTIHKSKGLEFPCVIMPDGNLNIYPTDNSGEWIWVKPSEQCSISPMLPECVPVKFSPQLEETPHEPLYAKFFDASVLDAVNSAYVAFTRAVDELHIFIVKPKRENKKKLRNYILDLCLHPEGANINPQDGKPMINLEELRINGNDTSSILLEGEPKPDDITSITYGEPVMIEELRRQEAEKRRQERMEKAAKGEEFRKERHVEQVTIRTYSSTENVDQVIYKSDAELNDGFESEETAEGTLMHAVMERVEYSGDLKKALLALRMKGKIRGSEMEELEAHLTPLLKAGEEMGWFSRKWRVLNERSLFTGRNVCRPDRIMVDPASGAAVIVDYKFGSSASLSENKKQVADYRDQLAASGRYTSVEAYLWYVEEERIVKL